MRRRRIRRQVHSSISGRRSTRRSGLAAAAAAGVVCRLAGLVQRRSRYCRTPGSAAGPRSDGALPAAAEDGVEASQRNAAAGAVGHDLGAAAVLLGRRPVTRAAAATSARVAVAANCHSQCQI